MNTFKEIMVLLKEKSGKKLTFRSVLAFLLVTVIVFFTVFTVFGTMCVEQMDEYLGEIPGIIKSRENELLMSRHIHEEDILSRAELGVIICQEESVFFTEAEMLQRVRNAVSADSVSLVNEQGTVGERGERRGIIAEREAGVKKNQLRSEFNKNRDS